MAMQSYRKYTQPKSSGILSVATGAIISPKQENTIPSLMRGKRKILIHWTAAFLSITIAIIGWMRFQQALRHWYYLIDLGVWPPPIYQAITGGLLGITHSLGLIFHFTKRAFTPAYLRIVNALIFIWLWIDRIFIGIRDYFLQFLAGTIVMSLCLLFFDFFVYRNITYAHKMREDAAED